MKNWRSSLANNSKTVSSNTTFPAVLFMIIYPKFPQPTRLNYSGNIVWPNNFALKASLTLIMRWVAYSYRAVVSLCLLTSNDQHNDQTTVILWIFTWDDTWRPFNHKRYYYKPLQSVLFYMQLRKGIAFKHGLTNSIQKNTRTYHLEQIYRQSLFGQIRVSLFNEQTLKS